MKFEGTLNMSQQIDRMGTNQECSPCITPKAQLFNFVKKRPFTGVDKLVFQGFPVGNLKLTHLTEEETSQHKIFQDTVTPLQSHTQHKC